MNNIAYRSGYKYQVAEPYEINLPNSLAALNAALAKATEVGDSTTVLQIEERLKKREHTPRLERDVSTSLLRLSKDGKLLILDGYAWDGPSGPAIDTVNFMLGSLVHDALYQLIRLGHLDLTWRGTADEVLREICIEDGMSAMRAWWVYTSVKAFAQRAARLSSEPQVFHAP